MAGKDQKPPARESRHDRLTRIMTAPPSAETQNALSPSSKDNKALADIARQILLTPPSPETVKLLTAQDSDFVNLAKSLLTPKQVKPLDTLSRGEEFVEPTLEEILNRPALTETEILLTPPSEATLQAFKIGVLSNKDNSDRLYIAGKQLDAYLTRGGLPGVSGFNITSLGEAQRAIANRYLGMIAETEPGKLNPGLAERMRKDPEVAMYAQYAITAGNREGINGIMYANQLWQESRFNPDAVSGKGARGISQMMPFQQGKFGLESVDDFFDPYASMNAGAKMMFQMTDRYKDQRLALVAYNGGERAIQFVENKLGKGQITYGDWHGFMENRRSLNPTNNPSAWQNETKNYVDTIAGKPSAEDRAKPTPALK